MRSLVLALLLMSAPALANPLFTDPPATATPRARMEVLHIPSGGVEINGVAYLAAGPGPHPTIVICHGWPGQWKYFYQPATISGVFPFSLRTISAAYGEG